MPDAHLKMSEEINGAIAQMSTNRIARSRHERPKSEISYCVDSLALFATPNEERLINEYPQEHSTPRGDLPGLNI